MFEHVLVADWSARADAAPAAPSRDAIWWHATWLGEPRYCRTQAEAEAEILGALRKAPGRVLAGFDFCFALPAWAMERLGGWRRLWAFLEQRGGRSPAEIAMELNVALGGGVDGPFWGFPAMPRKPRPYLWTEFRACELRMKAAGLHPKPVFQIRGAGAVGGQSLAGIGVLERLRKELEARVWPFEETRGARVVMAEVWPAVLGRVPCGEAIPDRWQVATLAEALRGAPLPAVAAEARAEGWMAAPAGVLRRA
ncbi:MAG: hypothetical protein NZR01_00630 [Bryobacteraceae bacterium]|nr:hypothetical protein [Bryobacteraceae bacterium]